MTTNSLALFAEAVTDAKESIAFRFCIVDNSRSMLKLDGHKLVTDKRGNSR